jgi:formylglycine-generating enzyme
LSRLNPLITKNNFSVLEQKLSVFLKWVLVCSAFFLFFGVCASSALAKHAAEVHDDSGEHKISIARPNPNDTSDMAYIRGGKFVRGSNFEENKAAFKMCRKYDKSCKLWWFSDEYPLKLVTLDTYLIDIYEVTNTKYLEFVKATGHPPALDDSCTTDACREGNLWKGSSFPSSIRNQPVTQVSWYDAEAYCKWRSKRLPTEAEWEKAARGPSGSMYPWGNAFPKDRATYNRKWKGLHTMTNVGSYPNGVSVYGVHDMAGNVWEWVEDWYNRTYYTHGTKNNPHGYTEGEFKSLRGGSWVNYADTLRSAFRRWSRPDVKFNDTGFRCAKSVPLESEIN